MSAERVGEVEVWTDGIPSAMWLCGRCSDARARLGQKVRPTVDVDVHTYNTRCEDCGAPLVNEDHP